MLILADSSPDISGVPPEFVKNFLITAAFLIASGGAAFGAYHKGKHAATGKRGDPVHVKEPLTVQEAAAFADKKGTDAAIRSLNEKVEAMARESVRAHEKTAARINDVIQSGANRGGEILRALGDMETRLTGRMIQECKDIHLRVNPLEKQVGEHGAAITALQTRASELWGWICKIWEHVPKRGGK